MSLLIKICGLKTPEALDAAMAGRADLVGFVFFEPSPRHVDISLARDLGRRVNNAVKKVALTVDADDAMFERIVEALQPDVLQLHGEESPEQIRVLKKKFGLPVMKAIAVETADDLARVSAYAKVANGILFDARAPRDATRPGGLGTPFDWTLLKDINVALPFMLSGGLHAGNVAEALAMTRAPGVDVSSGVERAPGDKDPDKILAFIKAARAAALLPAQIMKAASNA